MAFNPTKGYPVAYPRGAVNGVQLRGYVLGFPKIPIYARSSVVIGAQTYNAFLVKVGKYPRILEFQVPTG